MEMISSGAKLRVGLLIDSFAVPSWAHAMLSKLQTSDYAQICLVVLNAKPKVKKSFFPELLDNWEHVLFIAYCKLEEKLFSHLPDGLTPKDAKPLLNGAPVITVTPHQTKYTDTFLDADVARIKDHEVDVLIRLGFRILKGSVLNSAKFGIWSYHHADNRVNRGRPVGFWEIFKKLPVTGTILQILTEDLDNGQVLYRSFSATDFLSVKRNRNQCYWKALSFIPRKLKELHRDGAEKFLERVLRENDHADLKAQPLYKKPNNYESFAFFIQLALGWVRHWFNRILFIEQSFLAFNLNQSVSSSSLVFKHIMPPRDRSWGSPHIIFKDSQYYIFIDEFIFKSMTGRIALIIMNQSGDYTKPVTILERPYHLARPFIFKHKNDHYMIPETSSNGVIEVYKCTKFPGEWVFYQNLMTNIDTIGVTLLYYHAKWWLFANISENKEYPTHDELFLFYADDPFSNSWKQHPQSPVVSDIRNAVTAGKIFESKGNIYRVAHDCTDRQSLRFNRIDTLNEYEYKEVECSAVTPGWNKDITGLCTFNQADDVTFVASRRSRSRFF